MDEEKKPAEQEAIYSAEEQKSESALFDEIKAERDLLLAESDKAKQEIKKLTEQVKDLTEEAARARADYYNFRARVERDRERDRKLASEKSVEKLLPVFENMERICGAVDDKDSSLAKGMTMVIKQFSDAMYGMGLEMIPTEGQFDPSVHEAISLEPVKEEAKDGHIIETLRKGYKLAGRVMRAAQVRVGKYSG
jgi:molecular chaperone GrpE